MNDAIETPYQDLLLSERNLRRAMRQATSIHFRHHKQRGDFLEICKRAIEVIGKAKLMLDEHEEKSTES